MRRIIADWLHTLAFWIVPPHPITVTVGESGELGRLLQAEIEKHEGGAYPSFGNDVTVIEQGKK